MRTTSRVMSTFLTLAVPLASLLLASVVLIAASLGLC